MSEKAMSDSISLRAGLRAARSPLANVDVIHIPKNLEAFWGSGDVESRSTMEKMDPLRFRLRPNLERLFINPGMDEWMFAWEEKRRGFWASHTQGIACDGRSWYVSWDRQAFPSDDRGVVKLPLNLEDAVSTTWRPGDKYGRHLGDIDLGWFRGEDCVFVPYEENDELVGAVVVLDRDLNEVHHDLLKGKDGGTPPTGPKGSWCAFNPATASCTLPCSTFR